MGLKNLKDRFNETTGEVVGKAKEYGSKAASIAADGVSAAADAIQDGQRKLKTKIYSPVFEEEYKDPNYDLPKMIVIVDEDERKGIDVCEGAIGWFSKESGLEVLHLYEEYIDKSGLLFYPLPICDAAYFIDPHDKERFVNLASYFDVMQKEKITELREIAYMLGAKKCSLESYESEKIVTLKKTKADSGLDNKEVQAHLGASIENGESTSIYSEKKMVFEQEFDGEMTPKEPALKWFANDPEIAHLIRTRMGKDGMNVSKLYRIELDNSASSSMSSRLGCKIDGALKKLKARFNFLIEEEALREHRQKMIFNVEF